MSKKKLKSVKVNSTPNRSVVNLEAKPKVLFSKRVIDQVDYLHDKVQKNIEWSGVLFYSTEGDIKEDPNKFVCTLEYIYLMDIGTSGYTEYDFSEEIMNVYDEFPEALDWRIGMVHTH